MTDPFADAADLAHDMLDGEPTDAPALRSMDGTVRHLPSLGPIDPYMLWEGELTPRWQTWLRRGNGPYWVEGDGTLVISQDTDTPDEDNLRISKGGWVTWCGQGYGFEEGSVVPVFMRIGWESAEVRIGWIQAPNQVPALLRTLAEQWRETAAAEAVAQEIERVQQ